MVKLIKYKVEHHIAYIGLNRPEKINSFSIKLIDEFKEALLHADKDDEVRVIIIYGEGKAFSAGGDIDTMNSLSNTSELISYMKKASNIIETIKSMEKFVVSAVHGFAAGAGFSLAIASDFIIAQKNSKFISSFTNVGLAPDLGLLKSLLEKVSAPLAKEWIVSGKPISAETALEKGVINKVVENDLLEEAASFSKFIIDSPPLANQYVKFMAEHIDEYSIATHIMQENVLQALLLQTDDNKEGIDAFLNKRSPAFKGL